MNGIIYVAKNKINGKHYVGQSIQKWPRRKIQHEALSSNEYIFDKAINEYGPENFEWTVLENGIENRDLLNSLERLYMFKYESTLDMWGYNVREGGNSSPQPVQGSWVVNRRNNVIKNKPFPGATIQKQENPERKCWKCEVKWNNKAKYIALFEDPLSASIVYKIIINEMNNILSTV